MPRLIFPIIESPDFATTYHLFTWLHNGRGAASIHLEPIAVIIVFQIKPERVGIDSVDVFRLTDEGLTGEKLNGTEK